MKIRKRKNFSLWCLRRNDLENDQKISISYLKIYKMRNIDNKIFWKIKISGRNNNNKMSAIIDAHEQDNFKIKNINDIIANFSENILFL